MVDLGRVRVILVEVDALVDELDGVDLDERTAVENQSPPSRHNRDRTAAGDIRRERARQSQSLNLLADRLHLAAAMVRVEYWFARGHADPTETPRDPLELETENA